jgi:hypothetical protein
VREGGEEASEDGRMLVEEVREDEKGRAGGRDGE